VLHSAKNTRKRKYRQRGLYRVHFVGHSAKPLLSAKSRTRQNLSAVTEQGHNGRFAECQVLGTRQRNNLCRAPALRHSAKIVTLPSAKGLALGKYYLFAECRGPDTRQRFFRFCRVQTLGKVTRITHFNLFFLFHPHIYIRKTYIITKTTNITSISQTSHLYYKHNRFTYISQIGSQTYYHYRPQIFPQYSPYNHEMSKNMKVYRNRISDKNHDQDLQPGVVGEK
jgi:hypothetical protein